MVDRQSRLAAIVRQHESPILTDWIDLLAKSGGRTVDRAEVEHHARAFVRLLVEAEAADRRLRDNVLQAVARLCVGDGSDTRSLVFPARALGCVWRGLKASAPQQMSAAAKVDAVIAATPECPPDPTLAYDALAKLAADALRAGQQRDFRIAAEVCDRALSSRSWPSSVSEMITAAASKYTATRPIDTNASGNTCGAKVATTL